MPNKGQGSWEINKSSWNVVSYAKDLRFGIRAVFFLKLVANLCA